MNDFNFSELDDAQTTLVADLLEAKPHARPDFQTTLEEALVARLYARSKENEMNLGLFQKQKNRPKSLRRTASLAAAILLLVFVGGFVFLSQANLANTLFASGQTALEQAQMEEMLAEQTYSVVIAAQDIPMNTEITADMVYEVTWDEVTIRDAIQRSPDSRGFLSSAEGLIGQQAQTFIPRYSPIQVGVISPDTCVDPCIAILPNDKVAVTIPLLLEAVNSFNLPLGAEVDVIVALNFVDIDGEFALPTNAAEGQTVIQRTIQRAILLNTTSKFTEDSAAQNFLVTLAVSPQDATVLTYLIEAQIPLTLALSNPINNANSVNASQALINLARSQINNADKLQVGDNVTVMANLGASDETFTALSPQAAIVALNADTVSLQIEPEALLILQWAKANAIPLRLDSGLSQRLLIPMPLLELADDVQARDRVTIEISDAAGTNILDGAIALYFGRGINYDNNLPAEPILVLDISESDAQEISLLNWFMEHRIPMNVKEVERDSIVMLPLERGVSNPEEWTTGDKVFLRISFQILEGRAGNKAEMLNAEGQGIFFGEAMVNFIGTYSIVDNNTNPPTTSYGRGTRLLVSRADAELVEWILANASDYEFELLPNP